MDAVVGGNADEAAGDDDYDDALDLDCGGDDCYYCRYYYYGACSNGFDEVRLASMDSVGWDLLDFPDTSDERSVRCDQMLTGDDGGVD